MTKGVPSQPRACVRCGQPYHPASGPQRYCVQCRPIMHKVYASEWGRRNPERRKQINERSKARNPEHTRQLKRFTFYRWRETTKMTVLEHYSNGPPKCACCGETERDFLAVEHVDGHGNEHRRKTFGRVQGGWQLYSWLIHERFPPGFQILCFNCNMSKAKHGKCVHLARPMPPLPPAFMKSMNRSPDLKPRGDESSFVRWRPRKKAESQAFKESSKAVKSSG